MSTPALLVPHVVLQRHSSASEEARNQRSASGLISMSTATSAMLSDTDNCPFANLGAERFNKACARRAFSAMANFWVPPQQIPEDQGAGSHHADEQDLHTSMPLLSSEKQELQRTWQYEVSGRLAAAKVLITFKVEHVKHGGLKSLENIACKLIEKDELNDTFYTVDLGNVYRLFKAWCAAMPRILPFYAVKCNHEPAMLQFLKAMGAGFDCASMGECEMMLKLGVHPSKIIFAHPCKRPIDIKYAREKGIKYTTFDTESELHKIAALNPGFKCVLRIRADDPDARVPLGLKYGADEEDCSQLLETAKSLGLEVVGVSFHVGSACKNLDTFPNAIEKARKVFNEAEALGFHMELLDIGGGFTGHFDSMGNVMFGEIASSINSAVAQYFPPETGVRVIAEPGRYFAETASSLMTPVYGHRDRKEPATGAIKQKDYWLTDGLYGSFNCIIYDGQNPDYKVVRSPLLPTVPASEEATIYPSTLWGPTCDSADVIYKDQQLPQLRNGDWLLFPNVGAYTVAGACDFNGICATKPRTYYVFSDCAVDPPGDV